MDLQASDASGYKKIRKNRIGFEALMNPWNHVTPIFLGGMIHEIPPSGNPLFDPSPKKMVTVKFIGASGGPAGGQTCEKFEKQVLMTISAHLEALGNATSQNVMLKPKVFFSKKRPAGVIPGKVNPDQKTHTACFF